MESDLKPEILNDIVIIAGHPRSGTSLACQLVESAGVTFPSDYESDTFNRYGYYELSDAIRLSGKLIKEAMTIDNTMEMNRITDRLNNVEQSAGLKLVKIPALFFYGHIAKRLRTVFIFRNPADVKASMLRRGISGFELDWFTNNSALIAGYENYPNSILISFETILEKPERAVLMFRKMGLNIRIEKIHNTAWTQRKSNIVLSHEEEMLYQKLQTLEEECFHALCE